MASSSSPQKTDLDLALEHYATVLGKIEKAAPNLSEQQIVKLLTARDEVEAAIPKDAQAPEENLIQLVKLDRRLKQQAGALTKDNKLAEFCQSLEPPKSSWWWFLQPPPPKTKKSAPFDWVWHGLTIICLVGASSLIVSISQVFAKEGFDLQQLLGSITSTTGVTLVAGGSLTTRGRKTVANILSSLKIPHYYYPEANCAASVLLLLCTFGIWSSFPVFGDRYYKLGEKAYKNKQLAEAITKYKEALVFKPNSLKINVGLGDVHKYIGELNKAKSYYQQGAMQNDPASLNGLGYIILQQDPQNAVKAETLFRLALGMDLEEQPDLSEALEADIRTNLGHALLIMSKQEEFEDKASELLENAQKELEKAIKLIPSISEQTLGKGMAYCHLAQLLQEKGKKGDQEDIANQEAARKYWQSCGEATPETLADYKLIQFQKE